MKEGEQSILLVGHHHPLIHGQSIQYAQLLEGSEDWEDITVFSINAVYAETREGLSGFSIKKVCLMFKYLIQMSWMGWKLKPDAVIFSPAFHRGAFLKDSLFIIAAKKLSRMKVIGWIHMDPNRMKWNDQSVWFKRYSEWVLKHLDLLVSCAPSLSKTWPKLLDDIPTVSVPNGVTDIVGEWTRVYPSSKKESVKIGYLSAMDDIKGWRELFHVALKMCSQYPEVEFHFYGGLGAGESQDDIEKQFENHEYGNRIVWHGATWGEEKLQAYKEMDLYCFPSHTEAFPLSILEAMSFALPIVSTNVGAVKDAVIEEEGGWLCEPNNEKSLFLSLEFALSLRNQWQKMGEFNRKRYLDHFSSEAFLNHWHQLFTSI